MYRKNLDIAIAAIIGILGGLAAADKLPGTATIPLGVGLFFAPGYLWSEAILSQRLPGIERAMTSVGMALIFPILGGFLFFALHIPLLKSAWIGLLVVLTLLGVVAVAIQRLRVPPVDPRQQYQRQQQRQNQQSRPSGGRAALHGFIFGLAAIIGIGSVAFSVKNAEAEKFPAQTALSMPPIVAGAQSYVGTSAASAGNPAADTSKATQAHLIVSNYEGVTENYRVELFNNKKLAHTWNITLDNGKTWQITIAYTQKYKMLVNLYVLPNTTTPYTFVNNGQ
jgi:hypothetical protein